MEEKVMTEAAKVDATSSVSADGAATFPSRGRFTEVMWIHTAGEHPVGIVKAWDPIEERWKFYIGTGMGYDIDEDVQMILETGTKYPSLKFIRHFAGEEESRNEENSDPV